MGDPVSQVYSDPTRVFDPYALPDIEVFWLSDADLAECEWADLGLGERCEAGWYWWSCFPGCLPDAESPSGPFPTEAQAIQDVREPHA